MNALSPTPPEHLQDPDDFRMTVGEHLEDLRRRLILGLFGFVIGAAVCLALAKNVIIPIFTRPLVEAQVKCGLNPQLYYTEPAQPFMVYMEISMICGAVLAGPWLLYQLWRFVAAGLYPKERETVTRYLPLSIALLIAGEITLYFLVLPVTLEFFFKFAASLPIRGEPAHVDVRAADVPPSLSPVYHGDPPRPTEGQTWIDADRNRFNVFFNGETHTVYLGTDNLAAPLITLPQYIDMVEGMLVAFGLSFQLPLVVMALIRLGIIDLALLKSLRKYVYFSIAIISAFIIPDVATGWLMLMVPLFGLYELGLFLGARALKKVQREQQSTSA